MTTIDIRHGDILKADTDTIVNPANGHLAHGGGLARIIANAAKDFGREIVPVTQPHGLHTANEGDRINALAYEWRGEQEDHPLIATGAAGWTSAGALTQFKGIVHAVGPIYNGGDYMEHDLLEMAHEDALRVASEHGCTSIAFPAVSCGIFGFPVEEAAPIALSVAQYAADSYGIDRVMFYLFDEPHYEVYVKAAGKMGIAA